MPSAPPFPDPASGRPPLWRSRRLWHPVGYAFTGLWMFGVLLVTGGSARHPLFDTIFAVPLAAWIGGLIVAALVRRWAGRGPVEKDLGRDGSH